MEQRNHDALNTGASGILAPGSHLIIRALLWALLLFVLGLGLLYVITGRLWMSIGMHLGYDFIETSVLGVGSHHGFLVSEPNKAAAKWLTGGSFGPDAAIPAMILGVLINVVLWRYAFAPQSTASTRAPQEASIASLAG